MINEILSLESKSLKLEPSKEQRDQLMAKAATYTNNFLETLSNGHAYNNDYAPMGEIDRTELGDGPVEFNEILSFLNESVDHIGISPASPGHLGYIPGGGIYASAIGDYLAAVINKYAGLYYGSPGAVKLENKLLRWTADLIGYPEGALGNLASGGSIANLIAFTTARDHKRIAPEEFSKCVVYYTQQTHHCVEKAVRISGMSNCQRRRVKVDKQYRMDANDLLKNVEQDKSDGLNPFFIAASIGSTDTGASDPIDAIADIAEEYNVWLHLDAAYGGFFILVDELKPLFAGIERTDSVVLDPHKSLFLPYGLGIVLVKNGRALYESQHYMANYLQDAYDGKEEFSPCELSPELTKHFRGLRMWIPLKLHGLEPFVATLKEKWLLTLYFYEEVQKLGFEVGPKPDLSVCIYRYVPSRGDANKFNQKLIKSVQMDGRIFISSTNIDNTVWLRVAVVCFRTHLKQVQLLLKILNEKTKELCTEGQYSY